MTSQLVRRQMQRKEAHGKALVLSVGISSYNKRSGFGPLRQCSNDAISVRDAFSDVFQLNSGLDEIMLLTSIKSPVSKGFFINALHQIVEQSTPDDRFFFFYSGHGHRSQNSAENFKFYLVPEDAYSDKPEALIDFDEVLTIISNSHAKQKIIILDACFSGPVLDEKLAAVQMSEKAFTKYLESTKGIAIISSSSLKESSTTKSPNEKLSLFTYYLVKALRGTEEALDDSRLLTLDSLYSYLSVKVQRRAKTYQKNQTPCVDVKSTGVMVLGDFRNILPESMFNFNTSPISGLTIFGKETLLVKDVLTNIHRWSSYTEDYLEKKVNECLGDYLRGEYGKFGTCLRKKMNFNPGDVGINDTEIEFPGGKMTAEYESDGIRSGLIRYKLRIDKQWLCRFDDIIQICECLDIGLNSFCFSLSKEICPMTLIAGLEANAWEVTSELEEEISATKDGARVTIRKRNICFLGVDLKSFTSQTPPERDKQNAFSILALV